jgi:hypothetical protein
VFENLEFDGLDLNAEFIYPDYCSGDLSYLPLTKCLYYEDPTSFLTDVFLVNAAALESDCEYQCVFNNFDPTSLLDYYTSNLGCTASTSGMGGTSACSGLPYHSDFFTVDS